MSQRELTRFYRRFHGKCELLLRDFEAKPDPAFEMVDGMPIEIALKNSRLFLVNRMLHLWGEFCRQVVVASAIGGYKTYGGKTLNSAPNIKRSSDVLRVMQTTSITGPRINWHDPRWTLQKASAIQPDNLNEITLGIGAAPYDHFRRVRNFVIHSNAHTRAEFNTVALGFSLLGVSADELLTWRLPGGGTVMESWVRDFQNAALNVVR